MVIPPEVGRTFISKWKDLCSHGAEVPPITPLSPGGVTPGSPQMRDLPLHAGKGGWRCIGIGTPMFFTCPGLFIIKAKTPSHLVVPPWSTVVLSLSSCRIIGQCLLFLWRTLIANHTYPVLHIRVRFFSVIVRQQYAWMMYRCTTWGESFSSPFQTFRYLPPPLIIWNSKSGDHVCTLLFQPHHYWKLEASLLGYSKKSVKGTSSTAFEDSFSSLSFFRQIMVLFTLIHFGQCKASGSLIRARSHLSPHCSLLQLCTGNGELQGKC